MSSPSRRDPAYFIRSSASIAYMLARVTGSLEDRKPSASKYDKIGWYFLDENKTAKVRAMCLPEARCGTIKIPARSKGFISAHRRIFWMRFTQKNLLH